MEEVRLGRASLVALPVVRGLPSEGPAVVRAIESASPEVVGLSISPEELAGLRRYSGPVAEPENFEEEVYMAGLSAWETPVKPPPCFSEAIRAADERRIRIEALDMAEDVYTDAYTTWVGAVELLFQGRSRNRLARRRFRAATPSEFVLEWDAEVNRSAGFARLQLERERHIAKRIREIAETAKRVLAVVEVERAQGVLTALRGEGRA
jgi:hypothetical protein